MLNLIINGSYIILALSEILLNRLLRSKSNDKQNADGKSLRTIWITIIVVIIAAVLISYYLPFPIYSTVAGRYIGVAVIFAGIAFRLYAVAALGKYFTVDVTIRATHQLKTDGIYTYIRHPSYLGSLISFIGMGMTFNNWLSLIIIMVAILVVFINRIKIEEQVLTQHFGTEYTEYKKRTIGFLPFF